MYTLFLTERSFDISNEMMQQITDALEARKATMALTIGPSDSNGPGTWEVVINLSQVVCMIKHRVSEPRAAEDPASRPSLRVVAPLIG